MTKRLIISLSDLLRPSFLCSSPLDPLRGTSLLPLGRRPGSGTGIVNPGHRPAAGVVLGNLGSPPAAGAGLVTLCRPNRRSVHNSGHEAISLPVIANSAGFATFQKPLQKRALSNSYQLNFFGSLNTSEIRRGQAVP